MTLRDRSRWSLLTLFVTLAFVVTACQAQPGGGPTATQAAADQIDPNGEYTRNMGSEPDTIDPQKESFVQEIGVTMKVFEALMTFDTKTGKPIPAAAKDQPKVSSDGKQYTYTLRDGIKFSDGTPVTPADFKYGWERLCDPATAGEYAFTGYIVVGCEDWNTMDPKKDDKAKLDAARTKLLDGIKTDATTITFTLTDPAPYFNSIAGLWVGVPVKKDSVSKGGDKWTEPATFIGNGPFKLTEWKHNEKMVFERNDSFVDARGKKPNLKKITQVMINEGAVAFAAFRNNELDSYGVVAEDLRTINGDPELQKQVVDGPGSCTFYIGFNNKKAPFSDKNARVAFAKSFDRDQYVKDIVGGIGKPATSFIPPGMPGNDPEDAFQKFDVAAAKASLGQLTADATAALKGLKITYSSSARAKTRLEWFQQQWKNNLGVDVQLDPVDSTTYTQLVKKPETLPVMFYLGWCADYPDQQDWLTTVFKSNSTVTKTGYKNTQFDDLVSQADKEPDLKKRDDLYKQASRILSQDAGVAFIYSDAAKVLVKPWVKNYIITSLGFEESTFVDLGVTKKSQ